MGRNLYRVNAGVEPTTAAMVVLASGTAAHTIIQVATPSTTRINVIEWGISFEDFAALQPILVELIDNSVAASTATSLTPTLWGNPSAPASRCIGGAALTMFSDGSVTENTPANVRTLDNVILPNTQPFRWQFPLGREPEIAVSRFLRLRITANAAVNVYAYIIWEE